MLWSNQDLSHMEEILNAWELVVIKKSNCSIPDKIILLSTVSNASHDTSVLANRILTNLTCKISEETHRYRTNIEFYIQG